jgi:hypothetical protein
MIETMAAIVKQTLLKKKKKDQTSPFIERNDQEESSTVDLIQIVTFPYAKDKYIQDGGASRLQYRTSEGRKVLSILYRMKSQVLHKILITDFLHE